jgi:hypothetical protein
LVIKTRLNTKAFDLLDSFCRNLDALVLSDGPYEPVDGLLELFILFSEFLIGGLESFNLLD